MNTRIMTAIARPYATAAFEYALGEKTLPAWDGFLQTAALIIKDKKLAQLLNNPQVTQKQWADLLCDILKAQLKQEEKNFIYLLAEKKRLVILPEIAELFKAYYAEQQKTMTVRVVSAADLEEKYQKEFVKVLSARLQRQVSLQCEVDPALIAGAMVYAGDKVFDGSVRGKLTRLLESL